MDSSLSTLSDNELEDSFKSINYVYMNHVESCDFVSETFKMINKRYLMIFAERQKRQNSGGNSLPATQPISQASSPILQHSDNVDNESTSNEYTDLSQSFVKTTQSLTITHRFENDSFVEGNSNSGVSTSSIDESSTRDIAIVPAIYTNQDPIYMGRSVYWIDPNDIQFSCIDPSKYVFDALKFVFNEESWTNHPEKVIEESLVAIKAKNLDDISQFVDYCGHFGDGIFGRLGRLYPYGIPTPTITAIVQRFVGLYTSLAEIYKEFRTKYIDGKDSLMTKHKNDTTINMLMESILRNRVKRRSDSLKDQFVWVYQSGQEENEKCISDSPKRKEATVKRMNKKAIAVENNKQAKRLETDRWTFDYFGMKNFAVETVKQHNTMKNHLEEAKRLKKVSMESAALATNSENMAALANQAISESRSGSKRKFPN